MLNTLKKAALAIPRLQGDSPRSTTMPSCGIAFLAMDQDCWRRLAIAPPQFENGFHKSEPGTRD
jgi:hypothetical protein